MRGDPSRVAALIRRDEPIPELAREWLAGLVVKGSVRPAGRPKKRVSLKEAFEDYMVYCEFECQYELARAVRESGGTPTERAIAATVQAVNQRGVNYTEAQVERIVKGRKLTGS